MAADAAEGVVAMLAPIPGVQLSGLPSTRPELQRILQPETGGTTAAEEEAEPRDFGQPPHGVGEGVDFASLPLHAGDSIRFGSGGLGSTVQVTLERTAQAHEVGGRPQRKRKQPNRD